jgi:type I restriction enzyme S subunit
MRAFRAAAATLTPRRLDAYYYQPHFVAHAARSRGRRALGELFHVLDGTHAGVATRPRCDERFCIPFLRAQDIGAGWLRRWDGAFLSRQDHVGSCRRSVIRHGDVLLNIMATTGGAGYYADRYPAEANANRAVGILRARAADLPERFRRCLCVLLSSSVGHAELGRHLKGSIQRRLNLEDVAACRLPVLPQEVQSALAGHVARAERLRATAARLRDDLGRLTHDATLAAALATPDARSGRLPATQLGSRLDAKYYRSRALAVQEACRRQGLPLAQLRPTISNGFEHRAFVREGVPYLTVADVAGGRLDIDAAPRIAAGVAVPERARLNPRCVLVVRSGSVGAAAKVHAADAHAVISSHLIRLQFATEEQAAAVAVFLNSPAGNCLLHRISYGAVQPEIGQEELLALPVPRCYLQRGAELLRRWDRIEGALRAAGQALNGSRALADGLLTVGQKDPGVAQDLY